jgi:exopolysaccharide biosynthesis predicted pyruvyltransferase EpsI
MEFIVELLKEMAKGIIREGSAYFFRKQFLDKENENNEKPTLDRAKKLKRWVLLRKNSIITDRLHGYSYSGEMLIASLLFYFMHKNS